MVLVPRPVAAAVIVALAGCRAQPANPELDSANKTEIVSNVTAAPELPTVAPALARRDILLAAAEAASAYGARQDDVQRQQELDGRPFSFRIRLCEGLDPSFSTTFDPETRVLDVKVRPNLDAAAPEVREIIGQAEFESVEGFWVPRPWLLTAACPAPLARETAAAPTREERRGDETAGLEAAAAPAQQTRLVGIAEFQSAEGARSPSRQKRPFQLTRKLAEDARPGPIELVLQGRLQRLPGGKVISCTGPASTSPPTCIVSVRMDRVRMEDGEGELLAEWNDS
jgi:hypothetical protein